MTKGVLALQPAKMIGRGTVGQAIGVARWDAQRIQDAQTILQIADAGRLGEGNGRRQIAPQTPEAVAPCLLAMGKVQTFRAFSTAWWQAKQAHSWWPAERFMAPLWRPPMAKSLAIVGALSQREGARPMRNGRAAKLD
jgi:hypothetical protein